MPPWRRARAIPHRELPKTADVVVIGAGLTGLSAAYHLAREGVDVVVLEADQIGSGASGRTGGIVLEGISSGPREGARDCVPKLKALVDYLAIDCGLQVRGCWEIVHYLDGAKAELPWRDAGAPIGIASTVPGGSVEPGALTAGLAAAADRLGAKILEHRRVAGIDGNTVQIKESHEEISAAHVVLALNAWATDLAHGVGEVHSALTYACITQPLPESVLHEIGLGDRIPFYTADTPYLWGRVCDDNSVVFGAGLTFGSPPELERTPIDQGEPAQILERMTTRVRALHPALSRIPITSGWAGPIAFRRGGIPLLTRLQNNSNIFVAAAYAGHGVAFSVQAGALIAAAILHDQPLPSWGAP